MCKLTTFILFGPDYSINIRLLFGTNLQEMHQNRNYRHNKKAILNLLLRMTLYLIDYSTSGSVSLFTINIDLSYTRIGFTITIRK